MGTNFYLASMPADGDDLDPLYHIGKRSAAGLWCYDCGITLCKGGNEKIHYGDEFYEACPKCGQAYIRESLAESAAGIELGFAKPSKIVSGVRGASSFSWAMSEHDFFRAEDDVIDEYGTKYSFGEFLEQVLNNCAVKFTHSLGVRFC